MREHLSSVPSATAQLRQFVLFAQLRSHPFNPVSHPPRDSEGRQFAASRTAACCRTRRAAPIIWVPIIRWCATLWWFIFGRNKAATNDHMKTLCSLLHDIRSLMKFLHTTLLAGRLTFHPPRREVHSLDHECCSQVSFHWHTC